MRKSTIAIGIAAALSAQAFATHDAAAAASKNNKTPKATGPIQSANRFAYPRHVQPNGSTVLYSQTTGTYDGSAVTSNSISTDDYDSFAADDFTVTDAAGWSVSAFNFNVSFRQFSADPGTTYNVHVYSDASGVPNDTAAALCGGDELTGTLSSGDTALSVALPAACSLPAGHYWVVLQANINFATAGNQMYWSAFSPATVPGTAAQWKNPGDGFGSGCTSWSPSTSCDLTGNTFGFEVVGAVGGGGDTCPADGICLTVTLGTDTTAGACGTADTLDVTVGDQVNFCYTVKNNTTESLDYHSLSDNINGEIFRLMNQPLAAGATYQYNRIVTAGATETNTATWTAQDEPPGYSSTVTTGGGPITDRIFCDGFDGTACGGGGEGGFIDISSTGTALGLGDDDSAAVTMPFSFNFYGSTSNQICVDNNGLILFGTTSCPTSGLYTNAELPADLPAAAIMPLWDDFDSESGEVYYATQGTAPNRKFIVEWYQRAHYNGANNTDTATFEAIFDEATGKISFQYLDVAYTANGGSEDSTNCDNGVCATIGLQGDPTLANQFSYNQASIADNTGIDWEATDPQIFTSSDTVTLNVGAPDIQVAPTSVSGTAPVGGTSATTLDVSNVGNRDLVWSIGEAGPASHFPIGPRYVPTSRKAGERITAANRPSSLQTGPTKPAQQRLQPQPQGAGVPAYAFSIQSSTSGKWVSFDATTPGTLNTIATSSEITFSGDFVADDFSKEYFIAYPSGDLKTVDTTTGATATVGSTGLGDRPRDLAWDATTNTLFGAVVDGDVGTDLYKYDPATGAPTRIGAISGVGASGYSFVMGLAVDNNGLMYGVEIVSASLIAVDKTTGAATTIGSLGIDTRFSQALSFDPATNTLYLIEGQTNNMYTVDLTTGAATLVGATGTASDLQVAAFAIAVGHGPCSQPQDQPWLSVAPTSGTTAPSGTDPVTVTLNAAGLADGDVRNGTLCVRSNDPDTPLVQVPVQMTVGTAPPAPPSAAKAFAPTSVATGSASTLTITLSNTQAGVATLNANLVDTFPSGLVVAATPNASTTCAGGTGVTATAGAGSVTLGSGAAIPASGSCTVKVDVQSATAGSYTNTIPAGGLQTDLGNSAAAASASLTVTGGGGNIVDSGVLNLAIAQDTNGLYINWLTGATCSTASGGGCDAGPYTFNAYGSTNLSFFWSTGVSDAAAQCVVTGSNCTVLASGATVGPASTWGDGAANSFRVGGTMYVGFKFTNTNTSQVNYGYAKLTTTGPNGTPATLNQYWYDQTGAAITIP